MDVRDRLAGLDPVVDDAIEGARAPLPGDLWSRGQTWQTRRRRGSLAIGAVAVALVLSVISLGWMRAAPVLPAASPDAEVTLPDRIFDVPAWLPRGIAGEPVVAVSETDEGGWFGATRQLAALTGSGNYLFLDLPDYAGQGFALAPDGRHVGYWTAGEPTGDANTNDTQRLPVIGVAVHDIVDGTTVRHQFPTRHGLNPDGLIWSDQRTLLGSQGQWVGGDHAENEMERGMSRSDGSWSWARGDDGISPLDLPRDTTIDDFSEARDGVLLLSGDRHYWRVELGTGRRTRFAIRGPSGWSGAAGSSSSLAADGTFAMVGGSGLPDKSPNRVSVTAIDRSVLASRPRVVPDSGGTRQVLGWREPGTLLLVRVHGNAWWRPSIDTVVVETGESDELIALPPDSNVGWAWAEDMLTAEVVPGVEPPSPLDPRVLVGGLVAVVLAAGGSLVWWRRRVQP